MKTARRHELRENELAQQLEVMGDTLRRHGPLIAVVIAALAAAWIGASLYFSSQRSTLSDAWTLLEMQPDKVAAAPGDRVGRYRELADRGINETISAVALERAAFAAVEAMQKARAAGNTNDTGRWAAEAKQLYDTLLARYPNRLLSVAAARMGMGRLAEERGDYDEARRIYESVKGDARLDPLAIGVQAEYRLERMSQWKTPVKFAPAPPPASAPATQAAATQPAPRSVFKIPATQPATP